MEFIDIMNLLADIKLGVIASVDSDNKPHARNIHVGFANEEGVFFTTSPKTNFYQQITHNPNIALQALKDEDGQKEVIRMEGVCRELGRDKLQAILGSNPYVDQVYPEKPDQQSMQVFQLYSGEVYYQALGKTDKIVYEF